MCVSACVCACGCACVCVCVCVCVCRGVDGVDLVISVSVLCPFGVVCVGGWGVGV